MTVVCPECGSVNKKGNKFCFECGMKLPSDHASHGSAPLVGDDKQSTEQASQLRSAFEAKRKHLKNRWLRGEISAEEYRGHLLRLRLKERFGSHMSSELPDEKNKKDTKE